MITFGILTISDRSSRGERDDLSGPVLSNAVHDAGWEVDRTGIVADDIESIKSTLIEWSGSGIDVILTTGGTGFSGRDITPEATLAVIERNAPGIAEAMREESMKITPHGMLSRAVSGIRGTCLIINLPGSPKGAVENFEVVMPVLQHAIDLLRNDPGSEVGH
ncbi:MAG: MogA/MoaB family molybdenum cofactor biosynthesis protein [Anaerolineae bacterium]|nr:MogA/MoaB family molybdenum cofactor biosynthesis protein [Anaerolineae bacterium]